MSGERKFWIITEGACSLGGAFIITLPLFTNCPVYAALVGIVPMTIGLLGFGLWTFGGRGM